jgi:hypothetical protein
LFWIAVIIFAAVMLGRGGGRAERLFIAGASIKLAAVLLGIPANSILVWLIGKGHETDYVSSVLIGSSIFLEAVSMAGILCLVYAFWLKFNTKEVKI